MCKINILFFLSFLWPFSVCILQNIRLKFGGEHHLIFGQMTAPEAQPSLLICVHFSGFSSSQLFRFCCWCMKLLHTEKCQNEHKHTLNVKNSNNSCTFRSLKDLIRNSLPEICYSGNKVFFFFFFFFRISGMMEGAGIFGMQT